MKVITLLENTSQNSRLIPEHGLSLYIETNGKRILFDAGQTDAFAANAQALGIDLSLVDFAVLSHGHYDHGGGLRRFLQINDHAPVYMSRFAFGPHYNASEKYIGLDPELQEHPRIHFINGRFSPSEGISLHTCDDKTAVYPLNPFGLKRLDSDCFADEDFRHEIYMSVEDGGNTVLFSGCSHRGILNIIHWFRPDICIGGFHFSKLETTGPDADNLKQAAQILRASGAKYYTGHCTGSDQYTYMKHIMEDQLYAISCGTEILV